MSAAIKFKSPLTLLKEISREMRYAMPEKPLLKNEMMIYILNEYRKHKVTDKRICRSDAELQFLAENYYCYLNGVRKYQELHQMYHGKGERSTTEAAEIVGLKVPQNEFNDN